MKTFKEITESREFTRNITVIARDYENTLMKLLEYIKSTGNTGHSFEIIVDQGDEGEKKFYWDGDGPNYIESIKVT